MNLEKILQHYHENYDIVGQIDLDHWHILKPYQRESWLLNQLQKLHRDPYSDNQRILLTLTQGDEYANEFDVAGNIVSNLRNLLYKVDITNFFVVLISNLDNVEQVQQWFLKNSYDSTSITFEYFSEPPLPGKKVAKEKTGYSYNSSDLIKSIDLSEREEFLLKESKTFCMYPWIHLHAIPSGEVQPCCHAEWKDIHLGSAKTQTLQEIWNNPEQRKLRLDMLNETKNPVCVRCYEQEESGFFSGRRSANKHHGHNIKRVHETDQQGHVEKFEMTYWDIRFSNLCNLKCRSCGHIFSSQWYQDQAKLIGGDWAKKNKVLNYAGRTETDMWEQLLPHLDYVEQIYFAGGEPLLMEEHYNILEELVRRGRFDVRLIYNTNFTHTELKGRSVFEYWRQFQSVSIGASLDAMGARAEYIRKGTDWNTVERNRREMQRVCPQVDFYISPTLSIMNACHVPDFHRTWADMGLIRAQDLNVNILQDPEYYRIDIAPVAYKTKLVEKYKKHLEWLQGKDQLQRATVGFQSAIKFLTSTDNSQLIPTFRTKTKELDQIRNESILDVIPELKDL
jgi:radical SAM protein with 4Fe4S-binding SPASM domain